MQAEKNPAQTQFYKKIKMMDKFDLSDNGYKEAVEFLKKINKDLLLENKIISDKFTIISLANLFYEKQQESKK